MQNDKFNLYLMRTNNKCNKSVQEGLVVPFASYSNDSTTTKGNYLCSL